MTYVIKSGTMNISSDECPKQVGVGGKPVLRAELANGDRFDLPALARDGSIATVNGVPVLVEKKDGEAVYHDWKPDWAKDADLAGKVLADLAGKAAKPKAPVAPTPPAAPAPAVPPTAPAKPS